MSEQKITIQNGKLSVPGRAFSHEGVWFGRNGDLNNKIIGEATANYFKDVRSNDFPDKEESLIII